MKTHNDTVEVPGSSPVVPTAPSRSLRVRCGTEASDNEIVGGGPVVRLFGSVTVGSGEGAVSAGGPWQAAVLAMLALNVARPVSVDRLIDGVWGGAAPNSVGNALQVYVSALRKLVGAVGLSISRNGPTYTLEGALDDIDVERFQRLAAEGHSALRALDPEHALRALDLAWSLSVTVPLAGLDECPFAAGSRAALVIAMLSVAADRGHALCALGRADEAAAGAERLVEAHRFYEPAWGLLMSALLPLWASTRRARRSTGRDTSSWKSSASTPRQRSSSCSVRSSIGPWSRRHSALSVTSHDESPAVRQALAAASFLRA